MKRIILLLPLLLLLGFSAQSQEIIIQEDTYVSYRDSLFILRNLEITNNGIEGINDTVVRYIPPAYDTLGLINLIATRAKNTASEKSAVLARSFSFRSFLRGVNAAGNLISGLGADLDSILVADYKSQLKGRYRVITDSTNFLVDIIDHPNRVDLLRATGTDGEGNFNVTVWAKWAFHINIAGQSNLVVWDRDNRERKVFRHPSWATPNTVSETNTIRLIKTE
ncbi:MAG: hypothetical protein AAFP77_19690 [Bacteroidota bacterium]